MHLPLLVMVALRFFGRGIGVDKKVGEVGCPGRENECVRINEE